MSELSIIGFAILIITQTLIGIGIFYAELITHPDKLRFFVAICVWIMWTIPVDIAIYFIDVREKSK